MDGMDGWLSYTAVTPRASLKSDANKASHPWSRELLVDDVTVNGGFSTLLLLKLLILINLYVIFCQIGKIYHLRFPPKNKVMISGAPVLQRLSVE